MKVAFRKTSLVDYPGKVAAVIFFPFCNLRCPWCHNGELILKGASAEGLITLEDALEIIEKRKHVLGGVVLSGGEPTLFDGLGALISTIKSSGLSVKLDTNGLLPEVLQNLLIQKSSSPDFIAMDLKIAPGRYTELAKSENAGLSIPAETLTLSAKIIRESGIPHEFRSLFLPETFLTEADKTALKPLAGESPWNWRPFIKGNCLDPSWNV